MKTGEQLRKLNEELITELDKAKEEVEEWKFQYNTLAEKYQHVVGKSKVKIAQLEGVVDELTDEIDGLKEHLGQESDSQLKEQNKLLRQVLKGVL